MMVLSRQNIQEWIGVMYMYLYVQVDSFIKMNYTFNCYIMNQQMLIYKYVQSQLNNSHGPGKILCNNIRCLVTLLVL
jgi:hypothetical protein